MEPATITRTTVHNDEDSLYYSDLRTGTLSVTADTVSTRKTASYEDLKPFIDTEAHPVFITDSFSNLVILSNEAALRSNGGRTYEGRPIEQILWCQEQISKNCTYAWFDNQWFYLKKELFTWKGSSFQKVSLEIPSNHPKNIDIENAKNMIAVMLHRFRSPMTGMLGYLDLLATQNTDANKTRHFGLLNDGMQHLNDLLEEMEDLYSINPEAESQSFYVQALVQEIMDDIKSVTTRPISINVTGKSRAVEMSRKKLGALLRILLTNAIEHQSGSRPEINIELVSTRKIVITNYGKPVSDYLEKKMFSPFMTTKAQNMGIGLTRALLLAKYIGALVILTNNTEESGISFTILLPPLVPYM
ncbi:histidine kinase dimerization/phospho-acceptor domain-containing protein [Balneolaceae bacterium ANBcel3]|nr:histidine kinase dimerization/phospho-acceptor domain-containing protein [Balneolaceae bacterium ANBcel3]